MATPQTPGETKAPRALTMATYLKAAVGRASERLALAAVKSDNQVDPKDDDDEAPGIGKANGELEPVAVGGCETESSSDTMEELVESPVPQDDVAVPQFFLRVEPTRFDGVLDAEVTCHIDHQWAYRDVLLQPDEQGLGLNLCVRSAPPSLYKIPKLARRDVVVVASFRRLHADDIGPAEASGEIRSGDVLWTIEGERVKTLEAVAACVSRRSKMSRGFYLMRFLRPLTGGYKGDIEQIVLPDERPSAFVEEHIAEANSDLRPEVALLIRELVVRNQSLEEQLLASRLKQDEQRIQLDQLHALYAKTQLDNWSAFSLPKPFSRRPSYTGELSSMAPKPPRVPSLSGAAARLMGSTATQYDVEFVVNAERARLKRHFDQQLETEKNELQAAYEAKLAAMRATNDKKIRMLEFAVKELLSQREGQVGSDQGTTTEISPHVQALRHQLFHRAKGSHAARTIHADCLLCLVEKECDAVLERPTTQEDEGLRGQVLDILGEYAALKTARQRQLGDDKQEPQSGRTKHGTIDVPTHTNIERKAI